MRRAAPGGGFCGLRAPGELRCVATGGVKRLGGGRILVARGAGRGDGGRPFFGDMAPYLPFVIPFALFAGLFGLLPVLNGLPVFSEGALAGRADLVVYPLQTVVCGVALLVFRREYGIGRVARPVFTLGIAVLALVLWIAPVVLPGAAPRTEGFNPEAAGAGGLLYWLVVVMRFVRLVVVVPVMEEVFWRGFLQRYLIREDFRSVPFGTYSHLSFFGVAVAFMLAHNPPDWPAALACGVLYGWVACRTKSLASCILAHAVTNLLLGVFIMWTRQWGFW